MPPRLSKRQQRELEEISTLASGSLAKAEAESASEEEEITIASGPSKAAPSAFSVVLRSFMETIRLSDQDRQLAARNEDITEDDEEDAGPKVSSASKKKVIHSDILQLSIVVDRFFHRPLFSADAIPPMQISLHPYSYLQRLTKASSRPRRRRRNRLRPPPLQPTPPHNRLALNHHPHPSLVYQSNQKRTKKERVKQNQLTIWTKRSRNYR